MSDDETLLGNLDHLKLDSEALLKACQVLDANVTFWFNPDDDTRYYVLIRRPPFLLGQKFPNVTYQLRNSRVDFAL